jgi:hypothetical protein
MYAMSAFLAPRRSLFDAPASCETTEVKTRKSMAFDGI